MDQPRQQLPIEQIKIAPDDFWEWKQFKGFSQDTFGYSLYEDTPEEQWIEPTFNWIGQIVGRRRADGIFFYVCATVPGKEGEPINAAAAADQLTMALAQFDTYSNCACVLGQPCERHKNGSERKT